MELREEQTVGARLRSSIEEAGFSIRRFQRELEERFGDSLSGTSGPAVYRYLSDEVSPSADFLVAAGKVLGIRPEWLLTGRGEVAAHTIGEMVGRVLENEYTIVAESPPAVRTLLHEVSVRFGIAWHTSESERTAEEREARGGRGYAEDHRAFMDFVMYLLAIAEDAPYGAAAKLDHRGRQNYSVSVLGALLQLLPGHTHAMPYFSDRLAQEEADKEDGA